MYLRSKKIDVQILYETWRNLTSRAPTVFFGKFFLLGRRYISSVIVTYTYELKIKNYLPIFIIIMANNNMNIIFPFVKIADKVCSHVTSFNINLFSRLYGDFNGVALVRSTLLKRFKSNMESVALSLVKQPHQSAKRLSGYTINASTCICMIASCSGALHSKML